MPVSASVGSEQNYVIAATPVLIATGPADLRADEAFRVRVAVRGAAKDQAVSIGGASVTVGGGLDTIYDIDTDRTSQVMLVANEALYAVTTAGGAIIQVTTSRQPSFSQPLTATSGSGGSSVLTGTVTSADNTALADSVQTAVSAAAGARTKALPTGVAAGKILSVEKTDASKNTVTITGKLRGVAASSLVLYDQYQALTFVSEGNDSWRTFAGHLTRSAVQGLIKEAAGLRNLRNARPVTSDSLPPTILSGTGFLGVNYRTPITVPEAWAGISLLFNNWWARNAGTLNTYEQINNFSIVVSASIEYGASYTPILSRRTIGIGETLQTDFVDFDLPAGATVYVRTYVEMASTTGTHPQTEVNASSVMAYASAPVDQTQATGVLTGAPTATTSAFVPMVIGKPSTGRRSCVLTLGDSIPNGWHDTTDALGWVKRSFDTAGISTLRLTRPGEGVKDQITLFNYARRRAWLEGATDVLLATGINDFRGNRTFTQVQTGYNTLCAMLRARGLKITACTLGPDTSLTTQQAADRILFNDWLRTMPAAIDQLFDLADVLEDARNSNVWKAGYNFDTVHPGPTGHAAIAAAFSPAAYGFTV